MSASDSKGNLLWRMAKGGTAVLLYALLLLLVFLPFVFVIIALAAAPFGGGDSAALCALGGLYVLAMAFVAWGEEEARELGAPVLFISALLVAACPYVLYHLVVFVWSCSAVWWQWLIGHFPG